MNAVSVDNADKEYSLVGRGSRPIYAFRESDYRWHGEYVVCAYWLAEPVPAPITLRTRSTVQEPRPTKFVRPTRFLALPISGPTDLRVLTQPKR